MLSCNEVSRAVAGDLQREPWRRRLGVRLHLLMCDHCRRFAAEMNALNRAVRIMTRPDADAAITDQAERVLRRLRPQSDLSPPPEP